MGGLVLSEVAKDLVIDIINIIVLFVIVKMLVYKPAKKFLDERKNKIAEEIEQTNNALESAKLAESKRDETILSGKKQADSIIEQAKIDAKKESNEIIVTAKEEANKIVSVAKQKIETERKDMLDGAKEEITNIAIDISEQILRREVNAEDSKRIAEDFFAENGEKV